MQTSIHGPRGLNHAICKKIKNKKHGRKPIRARVTFYKIEESKVLHQPMKSES